MIDFSYWQEVKNRLYGGANGKKKCYMYNDQMYMVKIFDPSSMKGNKQTIGAVSEHIGSSIFNMLGIEAQETILGCYKLPNGSVCPAVACKDFCRPGERIYDFSMIRNSVVCSSLNGGNSELKPILVSISEQTIITPKLLKERFWDMFVVDALIGNFDRHTGNFGVITSDFNSDVRLAPVYDCGSSLFPQLTEEMLLTVIGNKNEMLKRVFDFPSTCYYDQNGCKYKYLDVLSSGEFSYCSDALKRILPRIDLKKICDFIDNTEFLTEKRKEFLKDIIYLRKELILDFAYKKIFA